MNLENQPPVNVFVDSSSDCISVNDHCYIKSPNETGPMTHGLEGFTELDNCFNCEANNQELAKDNTLLITNNTCITLKDSHNFYSEPQGISFGYLNIFNGKYTASYEIGIESESSAYLRNIGGGGDDVGSTAIPLGGSAVFKIDSIQYKAELNRTDSEDFFICLTKDPFNKTCNSFLNFTNIDYDLNHFNSGEQSVNIFRLALQTKTQGELVTDIPFVSTEQLRLGLTSFFLEQISNNEIDIFTDVTSTITDGKFGQKTLVIVQFWKPNGTITSSDLSLFSVDFDGVATKINNTFQESGNSKIDVTSDFDLDSTVNAFDQNIFGKGQRPNHFFELPLESSGSEVLSNFYFGDDLILKFNYGSEYEYSSNFNSTISKSLQSIANQVAYDFSHQNHGVFCDFQDDLEKESSTLEIWSPCSFLPLSSCELFISKSIISVKATEFKDDQYPEEISGDYFADGGAFSLLGDDFTDSIFWGQYSLTGQTYNDKPIYANGPIDQDLGMHRVMVSWSRITNEWILGDLLDPSSTYSLGKGSTPFSNIPITDDNLIFSPGFNGLPTFSNSKGFFIFGEKITIEDVDISPTFYITNTPYLKTSESITISQDVDFAKKLCKYDLS